MEKGIIKLNNINDISLLNNDTRYINISIDNYDSELNNLEIILDNLETTS